MKLLYMIKFWKARWACFHERFIRSLSEISWIYSYFKPGELVIRFGPMWSFLWLFIWQGYNSYSLLRVSKIQVTKFQTDWSVCVEIRNLLANFFLRTGFKPFYQTRTVAFQVPALGRGGERCVTPQKNGCEGNYLKLYPLPVFRERCNLHREKDSNQRSIGFWAV